MGAFWGAEQCFPKLKIHIYIYYLFIWLPLKWCGVGSSLPMAPKAQTHHPILCLFQSAVFSARELASSDSRCTCLHAPSSLVEVQRQKPLKEVTGRTSRLRHLNRPRTFLNKGELARWRRRWSGRARAVGGRKGSFSGPNRVWGLRPEPGCSLAQGPAEREPGEKKATLDARKKVAFIWSWGLGI